MKANKITTNKRILNMKRDIGNKDISNISDGTITGAISELSTEYIAHSGGGRI